MGVHDHVREMKHMECTCIPQSTSPETFRGMFQHNDFWDGLGERLVKG